MLSICDLFILVSPYERRSNPRSAAIFTAVEHTNSLALPHSFGGFGPAVFRPFAGSAPLFLLEWLAPYSHKARKHEIRFNTRMFPCTILLSP
jgi:hypothetical protein